MYLLEMVDIGMSGMSPVLFMCTLLQYMSWVYMIMFYIEGMAMI